MTKRLIIPISIAALGILILIPAIRGGFLWDEFDFMEGALKVKYQIDTGEGSFIDIFRSDFATGDGGGYSYYRPGGYLVTYLVCLFQEHRAMVFIIFGILFHVTIAILFYYFCVMLLEDRFKALGAALIFATQDLGLHAVIWPGASIFYVPFALFSLITIFSFVKYFETRKILWNVTSAIALFISYTFFEGANIIIIVLFAYYLLAGKSYGRKPTVFFFTKPAFYFHYLAIILWFLAQATQDIGVRSEAGFESIKYALSYTGFIERSEFYLNYLSREVERLLGFSAGSPVNTLTTYIYFGAILVLFLLIIVIFIIKAPVKLRFLPIWVLLETVPRYLTGGLYARGFYTIAFPLSIMLIVLSFIVGKKLAKLAGGKVSEKAIALALVCIVVVVQIYRFESFVPLWKTYTDGIKSETDQLFTEAGVIGKGDCFILMAPTKEQDEMIDKNSFRKRTRVFLNDFTVQVQFQVFDSEQAVSQIDQPKCHVMVGVPGRYVTYKPGLDVSSLIPESLPLQYEKYRRQKEQADRRHSHYQGKKQ